MKSLTSELVTSRTSPSLSMLGLQLNIKIRLYIPQTFSCLFLFHCTATITHKCTRAQIEKNFIQPHTFLLKQSLYIKYMEPHETNQPRAGNQKGEVRGGSLRSFPLFSIICLVMWWQVDSRRKKMPGTYMHKQIHVCVQGMVLKSLNHISPCHYSLLYCICFVLHAT